MFTDDPITTATIKALFVQEIEARQGFVSDTFDDERCLFLRSILPEVAEIRAADRVQGGVALRSNGSEAWVHPYVFRQVCRNGAIIAQAIQTRHVAAIDSREPDEVVPELREAILACASPEAFSAAAQQMRSAREVSVDMALSMMPLVRRFPRSIVSQVMRHFLVDGDRSLFGLTNAITATARDTADADTRWNLEEFGGGLLVDAGSRPPSRDGSAARHREMVAIGASVGCS